MKWMTLWKRQRSENLINPGDHMICLGSCFAQHVGQYLQDNKCSISLNPGGIMYNPVTISRNIAKWLNGESTGSRIVKWDEFYHSLEHHGDLSGLSEMEVKEKIENTDRTANEALTNAKFGIITFGSAWIYRWKEDGQVVANCHKIPAEKFDKGILSKDEIVGLWSELLRSWKRYNPDLRVMLTVSPVRHIRDGLVENQRSKSTLVLAVSELTEMFDFVDYFPSYEIMVDELRDYRFYAEDLVHPNRMAIDYIMNTFSACYFSDEMDSLSKGLNAFKRAIEHRPFFPQTNGYHVHLQKTQLMLNDLIRDYPKLDWVNEESKLADLWDQATRST